MKLLQQSVWIQVKLMPLIINPIGKRKIFVGDTEGRIRVLNYSNGAILKKLDPHRSVVSKLIYCDDSKCLISSSWDNTVNIHDELDTYNKGRSTLRSMSGHKKDVTK